MNLNRSGLLRITNESMAGPAVRNACCRSTGTVFPTTRARYAAALAGVSGTPAARMTSLFGIQIPAPERAADPPNVGAFSTTSVRRPRLAALSAAVMPAAPAPTTTTSYSTWARAGAPPSAVPVTPVTSAPPAMAAPRSSVRLLGPSGVWFAPFCIASAMASQSLRSWGVHVAYGRDEAPWGR
jgi:hypothetical protein